ncbi:hypothetical protein [Nocardioides limicola]|uniref:hypothetical protein n=1 Tax=Nocardioides limicola TaxID=2803368 RepID=UPI00193C862C|nr:hypothetical protein [Nocardioides sp. DJM-14]
MRKHLAALVVALMVTAGLSVMTSAPATANTPYRGFAIPGDGSAVGAWIGARRIGKGKAVYRYQVKKANVTSKYRKARTVTPANRRQERIAYIASRWGNHIKADNLDSRVQAAAVDAAILHLRYGKKWRITRSKGARRINRTPYPKTVRDWAKHMLNQSARYAGPYAATLSSPQVTHGNQAVVSYTLKSRVTGEPIPGVTVIFSYNGLVKRERTNSNGIARATFDAAPGAHPVTAKARALPNWMLRVRKAKVKRASHVYVAGVRRTHTVAGTITGVGGQTVRVTNSASLRMTGQQLGGSYEITGGEGTRDVERRLRGPFTSSPSCAATSTYWGPSVTSATGSHVTHSLPSHTAPNRSGFYQWYVRADGGTGFGARAACGGLVRVRKQSAVAQERTTNATVGLGEDIKIKVTLSGFDRSEPRDVRLRMYGPFSNRDNVKCTEDKRLRTITLTSFSGPSNGSAGSRTVTTRIKSAANTGYYVFQTTNPTLSSGFIQGGTTGCGQRVRVTS